MREKKKRKIVNLAFIHCVVAKHIERMIKRFVLYYSQIWLNLAKDDHYFSNKQKSPLKKTHITIKCLFKWRPN